MHVDSFVIVGATKNFANDLMYAFWGKDETPRGLGWKNAINLHRNYRVPVAYPYTPGQSSMINRGPKHGGVQIVWHVRDPRQWVGMNGCTLRKDVNVVEVSRREHSSTHGGVALPPSYGVVFRPGGIGLSAGGSAGVVVKVNKFVPRLSHPLVIKPPEQPRRFGSVILGRRSFMRSPFGHHYSSQGSGRASSSSSGGAGPSPLSRSSLAHDDLIEGRSSVETRGRGCYESKRGGYSENELAETEAAMSVLEEKGEEEEGEGGKKKSRCNSSSSSFWRPSRIPVYIRKRARSLTRSKSKVVVDDGASDGKKAGFGKLVKKASKDVLGKGFFGKKGGCTG